jgi:D-alanyl-D-alanine carboxypeptidase (penicillin-binding protein 5/6)
MARVGRRLAAAGRRHVLLGSAVLLATSLGAPTALAVQPAPTAPGTVGPTSSATSAETPSTPSVGGAGLTGTGVLVDRAAAVPAPPAMAAASYLLADLDTGDVLVAKAPHAQHLPASTLKVLTALTVMPRLDPRTVVTAQPADVVDGSLVGLVPGLTYTVHQLLQGMLLSSGNDAATALARVAGGERGVAGTVSSMQEVAERLGARDTVVRDPSGLDAPGQVTSAYDLALIARAALDDPAFRALVSTKRARFPGKPVEPRASKGAKHQHPTPTATATATPTAVKRATFEIQNHNTLLYNDDDAIGVKNGYTVAARWTIVGAAERDGHRYVVTALRRTDRSWRPTAALLDWAFEHGSQVQPVGRLVSPGELERAPAAADSAGDPGATVLAAGVSAATTRSPSSPQRWVGVAGLAGTVLLLALMALRARRVRLVRSRLNDPGRRRPRPAGLDARSAGPEQR